MSKMTIDKQEDYKRKFSEAGVTLVTADVEAYKRATRPFYTKFPEWPPDIYDRVQEIIHGE